MQVKLKYILQDDQKIKKDADKELGHHHRQDDKKKY
jgi:hypothetical protein